MAKLHLLMMLDHRDYLEELHINLLKSSRQDANAPKVDSATEEIKSVTENIKNWVVPVDFLAKPERVFVMKSFYIIDKKKDFPNPVFRTGDYCPMAGMWKIKKKPCITIAIVEGRRFPPHLGRIVIWVPGFLI